MKILVLASTFPASETDQTPGFVRDQIIALKKNDPNLKISVLAPHFGDETPTYRRHPHFDEYRFAYFSPRRLQKLAGRGIVPSIERNRALLFLVPFLFFFELIALLALIRKLRPELIYAHWFTPQGVNAAIAKRITGVPFVLTSHANDVRVWRKIPGIGKFVVRWLLPSARRITVVSKLTYAKMEDFFSSDEWSEIATKVEIIPMGVDTSMLRLHRRASSVSLKDRYGYGEDQVVLFLGRLVAKKGVEYLIEAATRFKGRNLKLVIAGDGPLRGKLEKQVGEVGLAGTTQFVGYVTGQKKIDYLHLADIVVIPSVETPSGEAEGFPVVIMEAMAAGKVCIATDMSGADSIITHQYNGFIVPQKDANALAEQLQSIFQMKGPELRRIGENARKAVEVLDWSQVARRYCDFMFRNPTSPAE